MLINVPAKLNDFIDQIEIQVGDSSTQTSDFDWIVKHCKINGRRYSPKDHEYQQTILEDTTPVIRVKKCAQIGMSVVSILRCFAKLGRYRGFTILYILPSATFSQSFNATRITPLLQECRALTDLQDKSVDSTSVKKFGADNFLHNKGAVSKSAAISIDADYLVKDEIDFVSDFSVLKSFSSRLLHSRYKFDSEFSTPTIPNFGISKSYEEARQKVHKFKCIHCGHWAVPKFEMIVFPGVGKGKELKGLTKRDLASHDVTLSYLECPKCGKPTDESLQHGHRQWVIVNPEDRYDAVGYHIQPFSVPNIQPVPNILKERPNYDRWVDYSNNVLGEEDADGDDSFSEQELEQYFSLEVPPTDESIGYFGCDTGLSFHYVVLKEDRAGRLYVPEYGAVPLGSFESVTRAVKAKNNAHLSVFDLYPYTDTVLRLQERDPLVWGCEFVETRGIDSFSIKARDEDSEKATDRMQVVQAKRDRLLSTILEAVRSGELVFRETAEAETFREHLLSLKRISYWDKKKGTYNFRWVKTDGNDHYFMALLYAYVCYKLRSVGVYSSSVTLPFLATSIKVKQK